MHVASELEALSERANFGSWDTFEAFEKFTLHRLCDAFAKDTSAGELRSAIQQRRASFWFKQYQHGYDALEQAVELRELLAAADLTVDSVEAGVVRYTTTWWRIDMAYRRCTRHLRNYGQVQLDKALVDIMKNYMANRSFSRGIEQLTAEASMVFMGNTKKSVAYMLKHSHFFDQLPDKYIDSAFLDRLHAFSPGWEVAPIRHDLFTDGYGFVVDYIAEILKGLRNEDFTGAYKPYFEITSEVSTRDQTGFEKTFSGLMKVVFPDGRAEPAEIEELLSFAMEARRRVREHILRIDDTFKRHDFVYHSLAGGTSVTVLTPEEVQYPTFAAPRIQSAANALDSATTAGAVFVDRAEAGVTAPELPAIGRVPAADAPQQGHVVVPENTKGWSYRRLFARHLSGARQITISDPYVRLYFQARNLMELLQVIHDLVPDGDEAAVHLITQSDSESCVRQEENLNQIVNTFTGSRIAFTWDYDHSPNFHARSIVTDTGWKITIDRGLDIFQRFESGPFSLEQGMQEARLTRGAEINYVRLSH